MSKAAFLVKITILIVWCGLFVLLLQRDFFVKQLDVRQEELLLKSREESFSGVFLHGERIGYVKNRLTKKENNSLSLIQHAHLNLNILNRNYPVQMHVQASLSAGFLLQDFVFSINSPLYKMKAEGEVDGSQVHFVLTTGTEKIHDTLQLNAPPFLSLNQRGYLLNQGLEEGDKVKIAYFDPLSLSGKDTVVEYKGRKKTLIRGRVQLLHHFVESFSGMRFNSFLDENGTVIKEESPAGFVFLSEPEFKAMDITSKGREILESVAVPYSGDAAALTAGDSLVLKLVVPEEGEFDLDGGRQEFSGDVLVVRQEVLPDKGRGICEGYDKELAATSYVQSSHGKIVRLGQKITEDLATPFEKVQAIAGWVYENIEKRPVLGIPDAVTTLKMMKGDCNEHAVLFAALARSAGIPTRIAAGVTFHQGAFYYHAWNEVCLADSWISVDTSKNQLPADLTHLRFVVGETKEQIRIGALLGKLQILPVDQDQANSFLSETDNVQE